MRSRCGVGHGTDERRVFFFGEGLRDVDNPVREGRRLPVKR
jgi:hypothetical protein